MTVLLWNMFFLDVESAEYSLPFVFDYLTNGKTSQLAKQYDQKEIHVCGSSSELPSQDRDSRIAEFWCAIPKPEFRAKFKKVDNRIESSTFGSEGGEEKLEKSFNKGIHVIPPSMVYTREKQIKDDDAKEILGGFKQLDCKYFDNVNECPQEQCEWCAECAQEGEKNEGDDWEEVKGVCKSKCDGKEKENCEVKIEGFNICKWEGTCVQDPIKTCDDPDVALTKWCHCGDKKNPPYDKETDTLNICNKIQCKDNRFGAADTCPQNCNPYIGRVANCMLDGKFERYVYFGKETCQHGCPSTYPVLAENTKGVDCKNVGMVDCKKKNLHDGCIADTFQNKCVPGYPSCEHLVENEHGGLNKAEVTLDDDLNVVKVKTTEEIPTEEEMLKKCVCNSKQINGKSRQIVKQGQCIMDQKVSSTAGNTNFFQCHGPGQKVCYCHDFSNEDKSPLLFTPKEITEDIKEKLCLEDSVCNGFWDPAKGKLVDLKGCQKKEKLCENLSQDVCEGAAFKQKCKWEFDEDESECKPRQLDDKQSLIEQDCPDATYLSEHMCTSYMPKPHEFTEKCNHPHNMVCYYDAKTWTLIPAGDHRRNLIEQKKLKLSEHYVALHYVAMKISDNSAGSEEGLKLAYGFEELSTELVNDPFQSELVQTTQS